MTEVKYYGVGRSAATAGYLNPCNETSDTRSGWLDPPAVYICPNKSPNDSESITWRGIAQPQHSHRRKLFAFHTECSDHLSNLYSGILPCLSTYPGNLHQIIPWCINTPSFFPSVPASSVPSCWGRQRPSRRQYQEIICSRKNRI